MFKIQILWLSAFLFLLVVKMTFAECQEVQEGMIEISAEEARKTQKSMAECIDALARIRSNRSTGEESPFEIFDDYHIEDFKYFWDRKPANMDILQVFTEKVQIIENRSYGFHKYENELINAIFSFMSKAKGFIEDGRIENDILPNYIQEVINVLDQLSPIEMFIHTRVIEGAINELESDDINFLYRESDEMFSGLSNILQEVYAVPQNRTDNPFVAQAIEVMLQGNLFKKNEKAMQREGFSDSYIEGLDEVIANLRLAESLQGKGFEPYATHIPEFAALIDIYIASVRTSIQLQNSSDTFERLELLRLFESEAHSLRRDRNVTYQWLFNFTLRLAILVTPREHRNQESLLHGNIENLLKSDQLEIFCLECIFRYKDPKEVDDIHDLDDLFDSVEDFSALINEFPQRIMIPTISRLGFISANRTYGTGVHFIRLVGDPIDIDGNSDSGIDSNTVLYPDSVFLLDVYNYALDRDVDSSSQFFRAYFQQKLETLTKSERKPVEYIYFNLTREGFNFSEVIDPGKN